jgi:menaquinone-dependent protoporphyrinogen oxidase
MNKQIRILIGYASNHGSTAEIADCIGKELKSKKTTVEIQPVVKVESVENYDVVIIGSPIYYGKWLAEIPEFVENNLEKLIKIPVACFITCMAAIKTDEDNIKEANGHLTKSLAQIPRIKPFKTGYFAGKLDYKKCTLIETILMKVIMMWKGAEAGDYRNWSKIKSWTSAVLTVVELPESRP